MTSMEGRESWGLRVTARARKEGRMRGFADGRVEEDRSASCR